VNKETKQIENRVVEQGHKRKRRQKGRLQVNSKLAQKNQKKISKGMGLEPTE
jgi:ABC-type phosphate transport system auxiliary subunit